jgi:hypothetical protein
VAAVLALRKIEQTLAQQVLGVVGLTLTAPAAWYAATGKLEYRLWLFNVLYFAGCVVYVRMHLDAAVKRTGNRWRLGALTLVYHAALAGVAVWTWPVGLALVPGVVRAGVGVARLTPQLRIKRLAWMEVTYSLVFLVLLVVVARAQY